MATQVAERYGQALYELACENQSLESWTDQARAVITVIEDNPQLLDFFNAVKIENTTKKKITAVLFQGRLDPMLIHFLDLTIDKKRTRSIPEILRQFISLCNRQRGIQDGFVYSARKLPLEELARIEEAMQKRSGQRTELVNRIDPRLISGIKVVIGNEVIDATMKTRIESLKSELLKESR